MYRLIVLFVFLPSIAFGWGEDGHRVVCQIAYDELTAVARMEVDRLLQLDPGFDSFAESCLFADSPERIRWLDHFMNVPRSAQAVTTADCPMADTCVIPAIRSDVRVLNDPATGDQPKLLALKLLGHWVGDIHQPMHVSFQDDRGGNSNIANVGLPDANLHGVWDYMIIAANMGNDPMKIAAGLRNSVTDEQRAAWQNDSPVEWANESYQVTIAPATNYCVQQQGACWYSSENMMLNRGEPWREIAITDDYLKMQGAIVSRRLQQAGIRLAKLLNQSFQ